LYLERTSNNFIMLLRIIRKVKLKISEKKGRKRRITI
jgi:hypothetical protein